jgi:hypothetical protein
LAIKVKSEDWESHQIIFTAEDASVEEKEEDYTKYFKLHQDNATRSGFSIDSTPEECLIMADGEISVGGESICWGKANSQVGSYVFLVVTIPLTNIKSFTSAVFRGKFYSDYSNYVTEIQFGSERMFADEFYVKISHEYKEILLNEIEINYTCAL